MKFEISGRTHYQIPIFIIIAIYIGSIVYQVKLVHEYSFLKTFSIFAALSSTSFAFSIIAILLFYINQYKILSVWLAFLISLIVIIIIVLMIYEEVLPAFVILDQYNKLSKSDNFDMLKSIFQNSNTSNIKDLRFLQSLLKSIKPSDLQTLHQLLRNINPNDLELLQDLLKQISSLTPNEQKTIKRIFKNKGNLQQRDYEVLQELVENNKVYYDKHIDNKHLQKVINYGSMFI
jgi:hypothetical protein